MSTTVQPKPATALYDADFAEWTRETAVLIRSGRFEEADLEHMAEEIEDMGKSQRFQVFSGCRVLLMHLLKWQYQPGRRTQS